MGRRAKNVSEEEALDYVLGYTCLNDVTARDIQKADGQWARGKGMDGFAPMGPVLTDEVDPEHLELTTRLNGKVVQHGNTELLITSVRQIIAFITAAMTLEPGGGGGAPGRGCAAQSCGLNRHSLTLCFIKIVAIMQTNQRKTGGTSHEERRPCR